MFPAVVRGVFYPGAGIWPLLDIESFQKVTGPKTDRWLVRTVGVLITVVGAVLLVVAGWQRSAGPEIMLLAIGCAVALTAVDVIYVTRRCIARVYRPRQGPAARVRTSARRAARATIDRQR
jgi:hypothetical protein